MPDTVRSLAALQTLLADNVSGDISANDVRDLLVSAYQPPGITPGGRLTTESGVAVSTSDRTSQGTIYYTPYLHNRIGLYDGTSWTLYTFTERSLALSGLTSGKNYDVFLYDNSGTLTLELSAAWTTDTARADALTTQDGVYVKSGATTRRYLGTIRTTSTTTTEDSGGAGTTQTGGKRFVWNAYNRVQRSMYVQDKADNWTYASTAWRVANGATAPLNCCEYVCGLAIDPVRAFVVASTSNASTSNAGSVGIGVDTGTTNSARFWGECTAPTSTSRLQISAEYQGVPGIGYHYLAWIEYRRIGTVTFEGDVGAAVPQSGMIAEVMA